MTRTYLREGERILVSACLLGIFCRFDGRCEGDERVQALGRRCVLIPVCPEQLGGLPTPRDAVELHNGVPMTRNQQDLTEHFRRGAAQGALVAQWSGATAAVLQPRSPSCGFGEIYDGTFTRTRIPGNGTFAQALVDMGLFVCTPDDVEFDA